MVGYPLTLYSSQTPFPPSVVQSTSPINTEAESAYASPSSCHAGAIDLQWPHQGARNLTNAFFPATSSLKFEEVNSTAPP
mmetsp:Transcript_65371/g.131479  ORF Transcript_65371/g.131479 Transcript_65371/m.131479 type:complete len:80 (-) Transcript_65371:86-325(-)